MKKIVNIIISAAVSLSLLAGYAMPVYSSEDEYQEYDETFESYDEGSDEDGYEDSFDYDDSDYAVDTEDAYASGDEWDNTDDGEYASDDLTEEDDADYVTDDSDYDVSEANEDEEAETEEPEETDDILEETGLDEETAAEEAGFDAEAITASSEGEEIPDPDANYTITVGAQSVSGLGASDPDDLFAGYFEQVLYPEKAEMEDGDSLSASEDASYAMSLNQIENAICQNISLAIADVAAGLRASTEFEIPVTEFGLEKTSWTAGELGVSAIIEDNAINPEAVEALAAEIPYSLDRIIKTLLVNHPYELYWYDKTESTISDGYSITAEYDVELGEYVLGVAGSIVISMPVATEYADGTYAVNCEIGQAVQSTVANAQSVVDSYAGQTDYEKLRGYMETICSLVSYNDDAASNDETPYGNPWQMIWVFDNDPLTSVVCEGYSKAFQYLCDKSNFSSSSVGCICVTGTMAGGTGEGPHMWNIVHMKDGENYLVDVTNCDEGSVGAGGKLFLIGQAEDDEAGSWSAGYTFQFLFDSISYVYDAETLSFYEAQELSLADQDYLEDPDHNDDPDEEETEIIAEGECGENVSWKLDSGGMLLISGTGDMWDYTFETTFTKDYRALISGIIVEDGVTSIGNNAFIECENVNSVTLSESILRIGECAFQSDYTLEKIEIPDSVVIIEDQAFTQCTSLKSIEIGASVSEIGRWVFSHTFELEKISVDENNACYRDLDGVLLNKDGTKLICFPHKYADSYEIQEGIISVGFGAFGYVGTLHNVCFPKTMRVIETAGFLSCELTSVVLYNTIQTIQPDAFASCYALSDVYFYGTEEDWASIDIQNGNTCLSDATIHYLPVDEPGTVMAEGVCGDNLTWQLTSDGILSISGEGDMSDWDGSAPWSSFVNFISSIELDEEITRLGDYAFKGCWKVESIRIPDQVQSIGCFCFSECEALKEVDFGEALISIENNAFSKCHHLTDVIFPDAVTTIENAAFMDCSRLKTVSFGKDLMSDVVAFSGCSALCRIDVSPDNNRYFSVDGVLFDKDSHFLILYPNKHGENYEIPDGTAGIYDFAFSECMDLISVSIPDTVRSLGFSAFCNCRHLKKIALPEGITTIESFTFLNCFELREISIPESVNTIGTVAFDSCRNLHEIVLPEALSALGPGAFQGCVNLKSVKIPDGISSIPDQLFWMCDSLEEVDLPERLERIGASAFYSCKSLKNITIPEGITTIGEQTFDGCKSLSECSIPEGVLSIGRSAFSECYNLLELRLPNSLTEIDTYAFSFCQSLKTVQIPVNITSIPEGAFSWCTSLETISFAGDLTNIGDYAFYKCENLLNMNLPPSITYIGKEAFDFVTAVFHVGKNSVADQYLVETGKTVEYVCDYGHVWSEDYIVDKAATCEETGQESIHCIVCGEIQEGSERAIAKLPHSYGEWSVVRSATCTEAGEEERVCTDCGTKETRVIEATGHVWEEEYKTDKPATYEEEGIESIHCSVCGAVKEGTERAIPVLTHNYGEWTITKEPTCTDAGEQERVCEDCGQKETQVIAPNGHVWEEAYTVDRPATCTAEGQESIHCANCGEIQEGSERTIAKLSHSYGEWSVVRSATCTEAGEEERVCTDCGQKETSVIVPTGHSWEEEYTVDRPATCTAEGQESIHCPNCGEIQEGSERPIAKLPHSYGEWSVVRAATCTEAGEEQRVCTDCGTKATRAIEATGHVWEESYKTDKPATYEEEGIESIHCSVCGAVKEGTERTIPKLNPVVDITNAAEVVIADQTYTGSALTPAPKVTVNGTVLVKGTDYTVSYKNNTNVGTAAVTIKGTGGYTGTVTASFAVKAKSLKAAEVAGLTDKTYTGSAFEPQPVVTLGGKTLVLDRDYYLAYKNNTNVGKATLAVKGMGNYSNVAVYYFNIKAASVKNATITGIVSKVYTGQPLTQSPVVKLGGKTLKLDTDYYLAYKNNTNTGSATIAIKGMGNYNNVAVKYFAINPKPSWIASLSSPKTKQITIKWGKRTQISGYQLEISTNKDFSKPKMQKNVYDPAKLSMTVTVAKAKTKYYIRIRSFKKTSDKTYFSTWSATKTVTTK